MEKKYFNSKILGYAGHIVVMGYSSRIKGRINPHCGVFTRKGNHQLSKEGELNRRKVMKIESLMGGMT